jgi:hypothetical protein
MGRSQRYRLSMCTAVAVAALVVLPCLHGNCIAQLRIPQMIVPSQPLAPAEKAAAIKSVVGSAQPISERQVFAVDAGQVVRLTEQNIGTVLSKPTLAAEVIKEPATRIRTPDVFKSLGGQKLMTFSLPTRYTEVSPGSAGPVVFKVVMAVLEGLHYDGGTGKFTGRIALSLINPLAQNDHSALPQELSVLVGADGGEADPNEVAFRQLNTLAQVKLTAQMPGNSFTVHAMTALTQSPDSIDVPVERDAIQVTSVSPSIRGFGLEETNLVIQVPAARDKAGETVALTASRGTISGSPVRLDPKGSGTAVLHSSEVGVAVIIATSPEFQAGTATVRFQWPVASLIATLLGAIVGSILRSDTRKKLFGSLTIGILAALIVAAAYAAGVSGEYWGAPSGSSGEAVVFFIAAMSGFLGSNALAMFGKSAAS